MTCEKDKVTELNYYRGKFFHLAVALFVSLIGVGIGFLIAWKYDVLDDGDWLLYGGIGGSVLGIPIAFVLDRWMHIRWSDMQIDRFYRWFDGVFAVLCLLVCILELIWCFLIPISDL